MNKDCIIRYLKNYKKAFIVVSHDREFINHVAKEVYEIEYNTLNKYSGNYDEYLIEKETITGKEFMDIFHEVTKAEDKAGEALAEECFEE